MSIKINKIQLGNIFCPDFADLQDNNIIDFSPQGVAVIYGPNGTGKTSFANSLKYGSASEIDIELGNNQYLTTEYSPFFIIDDQNGRNIIKGDTEDFILGDNIRREYELKESIENSFQQIFQNLNHVYKNQYKITKKTSPLLKLLDEGNIRNFIADIINNQSKGSKIDQNRFINEIKENELEEIPEYDETKMSYFINDFKENDSVINKIFELNNIHQEKNIEKIEQHDDALNILNKYNDLSECIICDSEIDKEERISSKTDNRQVIIDSLSDETKSILESIIKSIDYSNPFDLRNKLNRIIRDGDNDLLIEIRQELEEYKIIYRSIIKNIIFSSIDGYTLAEELSEYNEITQEKPVFTEEEVLFIEQFINECIEKSIRLERDDKGLLELRLGDLPLLHTDRKQLSLSNGEQNFISLAFELLKAKNVTNEYIILDDPISSFDSIYKNKIAYAILTFLREKKQIILTHSTDLIRLLEHQRQNCFNLFLLNNTENETNGFIPINSNEQKILLYIHNLINLFRDPILSEINDEKSFVISVVPFLRGYCQIINDMENKNKLTKIMHGYNQDRINISEIYNSVFCTSIIQNSHIVSAEDIINHDVDNLNILREDNYPLLNNTLKHTLTYLHLRLKVEKGLVDHFGIDFNRNRLLTQIIQRSFPPGDSDNVHKRVFLLSRKTLLNEFNHYEVDMNIFQPAIDITDTALNKEKKDINKFLTELSAETR